MEVDNDGRPDAEIDSGVKVAVAVGISGRPIMKVYSSGGPAIDVYSNVGGPI